MSDRLTMASDKHLHASRTTHIRHAVHQSLVTIGECDLLLSGLVKALKILKQASFALTLFFSLTTTT